MSTAQIELSIAAAASQSGTVDLRNFLVTGIVVPAAWTAADLTFLASAGAQDGVSATGVWNPVYDADGIALAAVAAASRHIVLNASALAGVQYLRVRSGTVSVPVVQAAARAILLITRPD